MGGEGGIVPKIADFGLAKPLDDEDGLTRTGAVLGTPSYMPPEQAEGRPVGPLADVYSLGAVLYECLTGRPPFRGATFVETLDQVRTRRPVPPRSLNPFVPRNLETVCLKCLEKDPARRYGSAQELADDLARHLDGRPVRARPVGPLRRAAAWARRRPAAAAALFLAVLAVLLGAGGGLAAWMYRLTAWSLRTETELRREAVEARIQAEAARTAAEAAQDRLDQVLYLHSVQLGLREWEAVNLARARDILEACPPGRRGWEWRYVRQLLHPLRETAGLLGPPDQLSWTADGKYLVSSGRLAGLRLWDAQTGREKFYFEGTQPKTGPQGGMKAVGAAPYRFAIDPVRNELYASPNEGTFLAWDLTTGKKLRKLNPGHTEPRTCFAIDPHGQWLAYGCGGANAFLTPVFLVDPATGKDVARLQGHRWPVTAVAASPDGKYLATGGGGEVKVWDVKERKVMRSFALGNAGDLAVMSVVFRPGWPQVVAATPEGQVRCWDIGTGEERFTASLRLAGVSTLAFHPAGSWLACGTGTGEVATLDAETGAPHPSYRGHLGPRRAVTALAFAPDGSRLLSGGADNTLRLWDVTREQSCDRIKVPLPAGMAVALDPRRGSLWTGGMDGFVRRWDLRSGRALGSFRAQAGGIWYLAVARDAERLASLGPGWTVKVRDVRGERDLRELPGIADHVNALALSPDGVTVFVAGSDGQGVWVKRWSVESGKEGPPLPRLAAQAHALAVSPDGLLLAAGCEDGQMLVWDLSSGVEVFRYRGPFGVRDLAFSDDGACLGGSVGDGVRVWRTAGWKDVLLARAGPFLGHLAFSPDGRRLATSGSQVTVWDLTAGQEALTLPGSTGQVALGFTADGDHLVGVTLDGRLTVWEGPAPAR